MYRLYKNNIKKNHTISMSDIHCTYNQSTYPNIGHNQHGQTWSTC